MNDAKWLSKLPLDLISAASVKHGLDAAVVAAIVWHESKGVALKTRAEVRQSQDKYLVNYRDFAERLGISETTEKVAQQHSWGLMQIMGYVARELGHMGYLTELLQPELNLRYGCMKLKKLYQKYGNDGDVISSYNQGGPYRTPGGMYFNQKEYVDVVSKYLRELQNAGYGPTFSGSWNG